MGKLCPWVVFALRLSYPADSTTPQSWLNQVFGCIDTVDLKDMESEDWLVENLVRADLSTRVV